MFTVCARCDTLLTDKEKEKNKKKMVKVCMDCKKGLSKRLPL